MDKDSGGEPAKHVMDQLDRDLFDELSAESCQQDHVPAQMNLVFALAGFACAAPAEYILEVGRIPAITPVPHVASWVLGVTNRRGEILSVVDLRGFLELDQPHASGQGRMVVARTRSNDMNVGFIVDRVSGTVHLHPDLTDPGITDARVTDAGLLDPRLSQFVSGALEYDGQRLLVFDIQKLLESPELRRFEV